MLPIIRLAKRIFLPAVCFSCSGDMEIHENSSLCRPCLMRVRWRTAPESASYPGVDMLFAAGVFDGPLRDLLHAFKYHGKDYLAKILAGYWLDLTPYAREDCDVIVPVPMALLKKWRRGYNQAELLAREVARAWGRPLGRGILQRSLLNPSQTTLRRGERFKNAATSFVLTSRAKAIEGKTVLLFDDVCTTGATLEQCAYLLRRAGAKRVLAGTVARELLK